MLEQVEPERCLKIRILYRGFSNRPGAVVCPTSANRRRIKWEAIDDSFSPGIPDLIPVKLNRWDSHESPAKPAMKKTVPHRFVERASAYATHYVYSSSLKTLNGL